MQRKKGDQKMTANPLKTQQQLSFESQWKTEEPKPAQPALPPTIQASTSKAPIPTPETESFAEDETEFSDARNMNNFASKAFHSSPSVARQSKPDTSVPFKSQSVDNFSSQESFDLLGSFGQKLDTPFNSRGEIPGLDIAPLQEEEEEEDQPMDIIDLDEDQDYLPEDKTFLSDPPPMPKFDKSNRRVIKIGEILDMPGRNYRPNK